MDCRNQSVMPLFHRKFMIFNSNNLILKNVLFCIDIILTSFLFFIFCTVEYEREREKEKED